ncbi:asparaginase [Paracraurococcus ruber]|uniref:Asparaginase n=1 Tax=Paracraurococcus ruber TaxID=77675 RepID=A0ABS1D5P3_9PROT|nr:asparaginase [Paracraurococcus ruber]MBK1662205.1 hypothetical protein [Paracraurococcus ruber]TDG26648.1 asparaginase [Paracraurococcus ruber]
MSNGEGGMADGAFVELARVWRGPVVESCHRGVVAVADATGTIRQAWGDPGLVTTPRSSLKPFQAVALVESGAADAFALGEAHIAMACASHHAQPFQVAIVQEWLARLGLEESNLVCGPDLPRGREDLLAAARAGGPRRVFHNCSGKHCGFLTVARHLRADLGYADPAHPAQRLYLDILSDLIGRDAASLLRGTDGCGLPALALSVGEMAVAAARFGAVAVAGGARQAAMRRVLQAMRDHPDHLSGRDEPTARLVRGTGGRVLLKTGAEGFLLAMVPDQGLGVAVKLADGAGRAKFGVLARALALAGALPAAEAEALLPQLEPAILDSNGGAVGAIEILLGG